MRIAWFVICFFLAGCDREQTGDKSSSGQAALNEGSDTAEVAYPSPYDDQKDLKNLPSANYKKFPQDVRELIRRADLEGGRCRGMNFGGETLRACNRESVIAGELQKRGWCWGGGDSTATKHWLKCSDDANFRRLGPADSRPYSEEEIVEAEAAYRKLRAEQPWIYEGDWPIPNSNSRSQPIGRICDGTRGDVTDMESCAQKKLEAANAELNRTYRLAAEQLPPRGQAQLRASQRKWLDQFESTTAGTAATLADPSGRKYGLILKKVMTDRTMERTQWIRWNYLRPKLH